MKGYAPAFMGPTRSRARLAKMASDIIEGEKDKIKGKLKDDEGKITGSPTRRIEGKLEEEKGKFKKDVGKAKYDI
jgi:uncharacterized protein YjbJ (UPF0337 family)